MLKGCPLPSASLQLFNIYIWLWELTWHFHLTGKTSVTVLCVESASSYCKKACILFIEAEMWLSQVASLRIFSYLS